MSLRPPSATSNLIAYPHKISSPKVNVQDTAETGQEMKDSPFRGKKSLFSKGELPPIEEVSKKSSSRTNNTSEDERAKTTRVRISKNASNKSTRKIILNDIKIINTEKNTTRHQKDQRGHVHASPDKNSEALTPKETFITFSEEADRPMNNALASLRNSRAIQRSQHSEGNIHYNRKSRSVSKDEERSKIIADVRVESNKRIETYLDHLTSLKMHMKELLTESTRMNTQDTQNVSLAFHSTAGLSAERNLASTQEMDDRGRSDLFNKSADVGVIVGRRKMREAQELRGTKINMITEKEEFDDSSSHQRKGSAPPQFLLRIDSFDNELMSMEESSEDPRCVVVSNI